jgi:hypothetical protein
MADHVLAEHRDDGDAILLFAQAAG